MLLERAGRIDGPWAGARGLQSRRIAPTLTRLPGLGVTGEHPVNWTGCACRRVLARAGPCGVANTSGTYAGKKCAVAAARGDVVASA